eukprot:31107-Pelagococcus_subviridis.AAC.8
MGRRDRRSAAPRDARGAPRVEPRGDSHVRAAVRRRHEVFAPARGAASAPHRGHAVRWIHHTGSHTTASAW